MSGSAAAAREGDADGEGAAFAAEVIGVDQGLAADDTAHEAPDAEGGKLDFDGIALAKGVIGAEIQAAGADVAELEGSAKEASKGLHALDARPSASGSAEFAAAIEGEDVRFGSAAVPVGRGACGGVGCGFERRDHGILVREGSEGARCRRNHPRRSATRLRSASRRSRFS